MSTVTLPLVFVADVARLQRDAERIVLTWSCSEVTLGSQQARNIAFSLNATSEAIEKIREMLP